VEKSWAWKGQHKDYNGGVKVVGESAIALLYASRKDSISPYARDPWVPGGRKNQYPVGVGGKKEDESNSLSISKPAMSWWKIHGKTIKSEPNQKYCGAGEKKRNFEKRPAGNVSQKNLGEKGC